LLLAVVVVVELVNCGEERVFARAGALKVQMEFMLGVSYYVLQKDSNAFWVILRMMEGGT